MSKIVISLPQSPKEKHYEDFIAAYFQAGGYYVEKNIVDKDVAEILELDILITDFEIEYPNPILIEIKSGKWGFSDVFKIRGWLDYTIFDTGVLVVQNNRDHFEFYRRKAETLGIKIILNCNLEDTAHNLSDFIDGGKVEEIDVKTFRFSYWVERNLLKYLNQLKKSEKTKICYKCLEDYHFKISSEIFLSENLLDRIKKLYDAFQKYPRISAKCSNEIGGGSFEDDVPSISSKHFNETYFQNRLNVFQVSTFIEHYGRITILKNCIEYLMCKEITIDDKTRDYEEFIGMKISKLHFLPSSFVSALHEISQHKFFQYYPVFWQWFLYGFGGFILEDIKDMEYELFSQKTGIPVHEIDNAFRAYEILFPNAQGWFYTVPNTTIKSLKLFSVAFRGIGVNYRRLHYTKSNDFENLGKFLKGLHTFNDLIKWNNLTVEVLDKKY